MFEHSLIELETKQHPSRRRWISLPIAVALHLVALTTFAFASYWNVEKVAEPGLNVAFISVMLPPPPPAGGGGRHKPVTQQETKPVAAPNKPVQPTDETVPDKPPAPTTPVDPPISDLTPAAPTDDNPGNSDGPGFGPGEGPGVGPGKGDVPDSGGDLPSAGDGMPVRLSVGMTRPEPIHKVLPSYTEAARRAGVQGTVYVEAIIDEQGRVTDVHILRGLPMGLDRMAVEAIQQWRFRPAMRGDKPVKVYFTLTAIFTIQR